MNNNNYYTITQWLDNYYISIIIYKIISLEVVNYLKYSNFLTMSIIQHINK